MLTGTLFANAKRWKQLKCSSMDEVINNKVYIQWNIIHWEQYSVTCYSMYESSGHYAK